MSVISNSLVCHHEMNLSKLLLTYFMLFKIIPEFIKESSVCTFRCFAVVASFYACTLLPYLHSSAVAVCYLHLCADTMSLAWVMSNVVIKGFLYIWCRKTMMMMIVLVVMAMLTMIRPVDKIIRPDVNVVFTR